MRTVLARGLAIELCPLLTACNLPTSTPTATQTAPPPPSATPPEPTAALSPTTPQTSTPSESQGTVTGELCYPSEPPIPAMNLYFQNRDTGEVVSLSRAQGAGQSHSLDLPPGTYAAYAWVDGGELGGSYSAAVPSGLTVECSDHSLLPIEVRAGATVTGVDICDWYGEPGDVPSPSGG